MKENNVDLIETFATYICASKRFSDVIGCTHVKENLLDLKAKYISRLSLDMDDLSKKKIGEKINQGLIASYTKAIKKAQKSENL